MLPVILVADRPVLTKNKVDMSFSSGTCFYLYSLIDSLGRL